MKPCPQCKYPNPDNRSDCFKCAAPLDGSVPAAQPPPQIVNPSPQSAPNQGATQPSAEFPNRYPSAPTPYLMPQANTSTPNRGLWVGLAVIFVCLMSMGINLYMKHAVAKAVNTGTDAKNYTIVSCNLESSGMGFGQVKGQILNNTNSNVRMATVKIDLFDASGKKVGSTSDFTTEWSPHETWMFEASVPITERPVVSVQISRVNMSLIEQQ